MLYQVYQLVSRMLFLTFLVITTVRPSVELMAQSELFTKTQLFNFETEGTYSAIINYPSVNLAVAPNQDYAVAAWWEFYSVGANQNFRIAYSIFNNNTWTPAAILVTFENANSIDVNDVTLKLASDVNGNVAIAYRDPLNVSGGFYYTTLQKGDSTFSSQTRKIEDVLSYDIAASQNPSGGSAFIIGWTSNYDMSNQVSRIFAIRSPFDSLLTTLPSLVANNSKFISTAVNVGVNLSTPSGNPTACVVWKSNSAPGYYPFQSAVSPAVIFSDSSIKGGVFIPGSEPANGKQVYIPQVVVNFNGIPMVSWYTPVNDGTSALTVAGSMFVNENFTQAVTASPSLPLGVSTNINLAPSMPNPGLSNTALILCPSPKTVTNPNTGKQNVVTSIIPVTMASPATAMTTGVPFSTIRTIFSLYSVAGAISLDGVNCYAMMTAFYDDAFAPSAVGLLIGISEAQFTVPQTFSLVGDASGENQVLELPQLGIGANDTKSNTLISIFFGAPANDFTLYNQVWGMVGKVQKQQ